MNLLKQSTAAILKLGPFVDDADFVTLETSLTIAQGDIQISKNGGAFAQTSDAAPTTTHDADGWYPIPLTATDTGTLGRLTVQVHASGALPVWWEGLVVPAAVYDSLVLGTDYLPTDAVQIEGGDATDAIDARLAAYDAVVPGDLSGLSTLDALGVRTAVGLASANLDTQLAAIVEDTGEIGVAGVGLSNLGDTRIANLDATVSSRLADADYTAPDSAATIASAVAAALNDLDATDVQTAVNAALVALHLDHLLAVTYDPASKPGAADALLNELVESDGGVARFTANALEQGPGGGNVTVGAFTQGALAEMVTTDTGESTAADGSVAKIAQGAAGGNVTVGDITQGALAKFATTNTGETSAVAGSVAKLAQATLDGDGSDAVTLTLTVSAVPSVGATVWITTDLAGNNVVTGTKSTNASGQVTFNLTDGNTYYLWATGGSPAITYTGTAFVAEAD